MSTPYTCPLCGYHTAFGNPARIALHEGVSHSGKTPIVEVPAYTHTGFECGAL
jgi:hypothetical protein